MMNPPVMYHCERTNMTYHTTFPTEIGKYKTLLKLFLTDVKTLNHEKVNQEQSMAVNLLDHSLYNEKICSTEQFTRPAKMELLLPVLMR